MRYGQDRQMSQERYFHTDYPTDCGRVISSSGSEVDYGDMFSAHGALDTLAAGIPHDVLIQTPTDKYMHLKFLDFSLTTGSMRVQLWEDATSYTGGVTLTNFIRRRTGALPTTTTTTVAPTTSTTSTTTAAPTTTTTAAPTTTTTATTTTSTTSTTTAAPTTTTTAAPTTTTSTTTTAAPTTTTLSPDLYTFDLDYRMSWSDIYRFTFDQTEAAVVPTHPGTSSVVVKEGGVAVLGTAVEIDAFNIFGGERVDVDKHLDHKWILRKDKLYVLRFWRLTCQ